MSAQTLAEILFWTILLAASLWETGFVLKSGFPFLARVRPGIIGSFLVQGMAKAYAGDNNLVIDFEWVFSKKPLGFGSPIYKELVALLQFLLAGSWLSMFIFGVIASLLK